VLQGRWCCPAPVFQYGVQSDSDRKRTNALPAIRFVEVREATDRPEPMVVSNSP
jgi:hypothetical protein